MLGGVVLLWGGGNFLLRGAVALSLRFNMSRATIGLTVVAIATSLPELFVCVVSLFNESASLSIGNLLGSNILNIALIVPVAALIHPLVVEKRILYFDFPVMLGATALTLVLLLSWPFVNFDPFSLTALRLTVVEGVVLLMVLALYLAALIRRHIRQQRGINASALISKRTDPEALSQSHAASRDDHTLKGRMIVLFLALGVGGLQLGAHLLVMGAGAGAEAIGVSQRVIGLTVVALGTSLPELFASIVAISKREYEIVLGNIAGSNIMNFLFILGVLAVAGGISVPSGAGFGIDIVALVIICGVLSAVLYATRAVRRVGSVILLVCYAAYWALVFQIRG